MDETYVKKGQWVYLYWAVDEGNTVDFMLSGQHDEPRSEGIL